MAEIKSKKMKMKKQPVQETQSGPDVYFREGEEEEEEEERPKKVKAVVTVDKKKKKKRKAKKGRPEDSDSGVEVSSREEETTTTKQVKPDPSGPARLQVSAGFSWDLGLSSLRPATADPRAQDGDSSAGEESEETDKPQKKSKQQQEQEQKEEEKALARREVQLMEPGLRPQDAASFERLLLASPNSSLLWLQYMANHLQATQIEQARSVAERALKTISFRSELTVTQPLTLTLKTISFRSELTVTQPLTLKTISFRSELTVTQPLTLKTISFRSELTVTQPLTLKTISFRSELTVTQPLTLTQKTISFRSELTVTQPLTLKTISFRSELTVTQPLTLTLKTISFREEQEKLNVCLTPGVVLLQGEAERVFNSWEEQEKLNVWVALLNLENMYGSEESLKKVFERAQTFCEPMPVYQQLADIYARSNKMKEAESLYRTMVKRFRQQKGSWLSYGGFLLQQGQSDAASALLQRALQSLPSTDSVELISKFAQLEYQYGDTERGRAMMDKILGTYPKRTDLWSVFMDLTIKHGSQKDVRALFDRAIHLSVAIKKVKFFFKRYLDYEKKHGTPESVQTVKEKALEFVEAKGTQAAR
ncbi:unnamed protein product [Gadus morhua 'NCC']